MGIAVATGQPLSELLTWEPRDIATAVQLLELRRLGRR